VEQARAPCSKRYLAGAFATSDKRLAQGQPAFARGERQGDDGIQTQRKKRGEVKELGRCSSGLTRITRLEGVEGRRADDVLAPGVAVTGDGLEFFWPVEVTTLKRGPVLEST
jgi:hypothetical protein